MYIKLPWPLVGCSIKLKECHCFSSQPYLAVEGGQFAQQGEPMGCLVEEVHHGECLGSGGDCGFDGGQVGREESDDIGQGFGVGFQSHGLPGVLAEHEVNEFVHLTFG